VVDEALVAGGLVFFTTFVPTDNICGVGGDAFLYVLDHMCGELGDNIIEELIERTGVGGEASGGLGGKPGWERGEFKVAESKQAFVVKLGPGVPSRPVISSNREHIIIQTSDAKIHRISVDLPTKPSVIQWKLRSSE
jgi:type IV pilus assembly protein PilY1